MASPVKRILQLDEEQDVSSRLEEVRAVPALLLPRLPATVRTPVRKLPKLFQAMDRMEKSWRALRAASRRQILKPNQPTPLSPLASATLEAR